MNDVSDISQILDQVDRRLGEIREQIVRIAGETGAPPPAERATASEEVLESGQPLDAETSPESEPPLEPSPEMEIEPDIEMEPEVEMEAESEVEGEAEMETEVETEPEMEMETEAEIEPDAELEPEPEIEPEPSQEPEMETEPLPAMEGEPEAVAEAEAVPPIEPPPPVPEPPPPEPPPPPPVPEPPLPPEPPEPPLPPEPEPPPFPPAAEQEMEQLLSLRQRLISDARELIRSYEDQIADLETRFGISSPAPVFEGVVTLVVTGIGRIQTLATIEETLLAIEGVVQAFVRHYDRGEGWFEMTLDRPVPLTTELAELLPLRFEVRSTTTNEIVLSLEDDARP